MINRMILANLRRRPMRSLVSIVAVAIEVVLILMIVGLTNGMVNDHRDRISGIGADIIVRPASAAMFAEISGNTMPLALGKVFDRVPGVAAAAPMAYHLASGIDAVGGVDLSSFNAVSGGFHFIQGHAFAPGTQQVIVDDLQADADHYHVGQEIPLFGQKFKLVGIFEHGMGSRIFVDLPVLDKFAGSPDKASTFYIRTAPGANTNQVIASLSKLVPADKVDSIAQYLSMFTAARISPAVPIFQHVMIGIAMAIGFLVIFLSLYTTVLERTREIGVLKSLGASRAYIVKVIVRESELLAMVGVIVGSLSAYALWRTLAVVYPTLTIEMTWKWVAFAAVIAMISSVIGSLYPAFRAAGQDVIAALAYE